MAIVTKDSFKIIKQMVLEDIGKVIFFIMESLRTIYLMEMVNSVHNYILLSDNLRMDTGKKAN